MHGPSPSPDRPPAVCRGLFRGRNGRFPLTRRLPGRVPASPFSRCAARPQLACTDRSIADSLIDFALTVHIISYFGQKLNELAHVNRTSRAHASRDKKRGDAGLPRPFAAFTRPLASTLSRVGLRVVLLRGLVRRGDELVLLDDADERVRRARRVLRRIDLARDVHAADDGRDEPRRRLP